MVATRDIIKRITGGKALLSLDEGDIESMCVDGRGPIVVTGHGEGSCRLENALMDAVCSSAEICLKSCHGVAINIFMNPNTAHPLQVCELKQLHWILDGLPADVARNVKWGISIDGNLGDSVEVAIFVA